MCLTYTVGVRKEKKKKLVTAKTPFFICGHTKMRIYIFKFHTNFIKISKTSNQFIHNVMTSAY